MMEVNISHNVLWKYNTLRGPELMAPVKTVLSHKPDDLSLTPGIHSGRRKPGAEGCPLPIVDCGRDVLSSTHDKHTHIQKN